MTLLTHPALDVGLRPLPGRMFVQLDDEKLKTDTGIILPDISVSPTTQGFVRAVGSTSHEALLGLRVALVPATGSLLHICQPKLKLPYDLVECDEGDLLAIWLQGDTTTLRYPDNLPKDSIARSWSPVEGHVLMRPYSPVYARPSGLVAWKNESHPRVWAHLLAVPHDRLVPGALVVYARYADDLLGYDRRHTGEKNLPVVIAPIRELHAMQYPAPVTLEVD